MTDAPLINRVANSGIITFNLEDYYPQHDIVTLDLKDYLFMGMILKEKDFREAMQAHDWTQYTGKYLVVTCSADAIIPLWAYMLVATYATPHAIEVAEGNTENFVRTHYAHALTKLDVSVYKDARVVIKGCGDKPVPAFAYSEITRLLTPVVKSLMYGEPCSTVPIYKKKATV
jgi:hypothetical protein